MKGLLAIVLLLVAAVFLFNQHTQKHPIFSRETIQYRQYLNANIVNTINNMQTSWTAGHNKKWDDMGIDAIKGLMGSLPSQHTLQVVGRVANDIPAEFDARTQWPNCQSIKEIRDQAACGSCWAFGAAEAMSDRVCIASGQTVQTKISTQDLVTCCATCGQGCNGGYPEMAWQYFVRTGLCTGDLYGDNTWCEPYSIPPCDHHTTGQYAPCGDTVPTPPCNKTCNPQYGKAFDQDIHKGKTAYSVRANVEAIQTEIQTNGPVECAFTVYEDFLTYKTGVYVHKTGQALGGHAVKMMGWGVENSQAYWLIANSWNPDWGDQGYFKILRGVNECGIESEVVAGLV